jgi:multimeric flavodoxin WrbA
MKVLGLTCGRKMGNSEVLIREALKGAQEASGADIEIIRMLDLNIKPCIGCEKCVYDRFAGGEGDCIIKNDHIPFLMDKVMECDGIIISAPCYCARPPGYLMVLQDRFLGFPIRHRKKLAEKPMVKGVIAIGGSDMVGIMLPFLNRCPSANVGKLVDQMMVIWTSRPDQIVLNEEAVARARKLGQNVGRAMKMPSSEWKYVGEIEKNPDASKRSDTDLTTQLTPYYEACPVCHSDLIRLRGNTVECPTCYMKGTMEIKNGVPKFVCDPVKSPSPYAGIAGRKRHDDDGIRVADKLVKERKPEIQEIMKKYSAGITVIQPPSLKTGNKTGA